MSINSNFAPQSLSDFTNNLSATRPSAQQVYQPNLTSENDSFTKSGVLQDNLNNAKRKNGIVEKVYDFAKNLTGIGTGSKKVQEAVKKAEAGEISEEEANSIIKKYRNSQEKSAQSFGDIASVAAAGSAFFGIKNLLVKTSAIVGNNKKAIEGLFGDGKIAKTAMNVLQSKKGIVGIATAAAVLAGGFAKVYAMNINNFGSKRYKLDKNANLSKEEKKAQKKQLKKEKRNAGLRNFLSGAVNGALMPVMTLGTAIGAPIYLAGNMLSRYFIGEKNADEKKSFKGLFDSVKNSWITTAATTAAIAVPLIKKGNFSQVLETNSQKVAEKIKNATLTQFEAGSSAYQELDQILSSSSKIKGIIEDDSIDVAEKIKQLLDENIFAVKFKQIQNSNLGDSAIGGIDQLSRALKENCPATYTLEEAQKFVEGTFGGKYKLEKCLGVGTVAETYLAKTEDGQEVCIKLLKKGIDADKIEKDKQAFIAIINGLTDKTPEEKAYLIRNLENLAEGISQEVNLENEMEAARKLAKSTGAACVVKPIEVKNGVYVMEKANGISLGTLTKLQDLQRERIYYAAHQDNSYCAERLKSIDAEIQDILSKNPALGNGELSKQDMDYMLSEYMKVLVEQFSKTDPNGKAIHGDIHKGNIIIDPQKLKERRGQIFTLIDTGNVVNQTTEQAVSAMNLTKYISNCDVKNLSAYVLDGAVLPEGMTQQQALEKVEAELRKIFFDYETGIGKMDNDTFSAMAATVMKKLGIIPSDTQGNLAKAKKSAEDSLGSLRTTLYSRIEDEAYASLSENASVAERSKTGAKMLGSILKNEIIYGARKGIQERLNLLKMPASQRLKLKDGSKIKKNSEEYLTYIFKQYQQRGGLMG